MKEHRIDAHTIEMRDEPEVHRSGYSQVFDPNYRAPEYSTNTTCTNDFAPSRKEPDRSYYRRTFGK